MDLFIIFEQKLFILKYYNEINIYEIKNKNREEIERLYILVYENESAADEIRRAFEISMYEGAFLPNFRGDLLGLSEQFDKIANKCEKITEYYVLENLTIPEILIEDLVLQMELSLKSFKSAKKAAYSLVNDTTKVEKHISNSCERESIEDEVERKLIKKVYDMGIQLAEKQQLGKFVRAIGNLADKEFATLVVNCCQFSFSILSLTP